MTIFSLYEPTTGKKLDIGLCKGMTINYTLSTDGNDGLYIDYYYLFKNKKMVNASVDIYNSSDPFFNTRCIAYPDYVTKTDVVLNYRRQNIYSSQDINCTLYGGQRCTFRGFDTNNYTICECEIQADSVQNNSLKIYRSIDAKYLSEVSSQNQDVAACGHYTFNKEIKGNAGFWVSITDMILGIGSIVLTVILSKATNSAIPSNPPPKDDAPRKVNTVLNTDEIVIEMHERKSDAPVQTEQQSPKPTYEGHIRVNSENRPAIMTEGEEMGNDLKIHGPPAIHDEMNYYEEMPFEKELFEDTRSAFKYFCHKLIVSNFILRVPFKNSYSEPIYHRILYFSLYIMLFFSWNAFFFDEIMISQRIGDTNDSFAYTWTHEFWKCIVSTFLTFTSVSLIKMIFDLPKDRQEHIRSEISACSKVTAPEYYSELLAQHRLRFILMYIVQFAIHILCWYYMVNFCGIYLLTQVAWAYGAVVSFIMMVAFSITFIPIYVTITRMLAKKYSKAIWILKVFH